MDARSSNSPASRDGRIGFFREAAGAWPALAIATLVLTFGPSGLQCYAFGVFVAPLSQEFGWTLAEQNLAFSMVLVGQVACSAPAGFLLDKYGPRAVALALMGVIVLGTLSLALDPGILLLRYIASAVLGGSLGAVMLAFAALLNRYFQQARGAALGIMSSGVGLGAIIGPPLMRWVVDHHGWRSGYFVDAAILALLIPAMLLWFRAPAAGTVAAQADLRSGAKLSRAMRGPAFWLIAFAFCFYGAAAGGFLPNIIPYLTSTGISREAAANYVGVLGIGTLAGRIAAGILMDKLSTAGVLATLMTVVAIAMGLLGNGGILIAAPILFAYGLAHGGEAAGIPVVVSRYFGLRHFGAVLGVVSTIAFTGFALGPILFSLIASSHGFTASLLLAAAMAGAGGVLMWLAARCSRALAGIAD